MHDRVKVSITTEDGELIDSFCLSDWLMCDDLPPVDEEENCGSMASEALLMHRLKRWVRRKKRA